MIGPAFLTAYRLATWAPRNRFIILSQRRTGSTMLAKRLDTHPDLKAKGEILLSHVPTGIAERWGRPHFLRTKLDHSLADLRENNPCAFIETFAWRTRHPRVHTVGFKAPWLAILNLRDEDRQRLLSDRRLRIIWLERRDLLGQFVSDVTAHKSGWYSLATGDARRAVPAVSIRPERFIAFIAGRMAQAARLRVMIAHLPRLCVTYEDLVANAGHENERLCSFLGIRGLPLHDQTQKIATAPLNERVVNFESFADALRGTKYEAYLPNGHAMAEPG